MITKEQLGNFLYIQNCIEVYVKLYLKVKYYLKKAEFLRLHINGDLILVEYIIPIEISKKVSTPSVQKIYFNLSDICLNYSEYMLILRKEEIEVDNSNVE